MKDLKYTGKLYLEINGERVFGPGRLELLERIQASGSIRQAALQMKMSYRRAWEFIDHMNTHLGEAVVIAERGGRGGGQAIVTPKGLNAIREFKAFHQKFREFLQEHSAQINI
ncbi:winged helix-turn-helix domain-containing protein [Mucilaginibacter lacusdianchii]|uniref:winged helix-turn-helix domain-containing protein n=1 Tax=Mucilaginibacter lacusdianchii TaxID=2684211 RepID=UPI001E2AB60A|nr:LysR family transcriptional regulator [Mucilaginibacter sp. JXJ CY 39]